MAGEETSAQKTQRTEIVSTKQEAQLAQAKRVALPDDTYHRFNAVSGPERSPSPQSEAYGLHGAPGTMHV